MSVLVLASTALALLAVPACLYLGALAILARRMPTVARADGPCLAVVVPAHDEEAQIEATVRSVLATEYPPAQRRVLVVADNCTDATAARAQAAGAEILTRVDAQHRGKGFALALAFDQLLDEGWADAVVVIDADTLVSSNLLGGFAARLQRGAQAIQAEYGVRNVDESWRTTLMTLALAMFHRTRSLARERLGLSCGLRGNGMCFSSALLRQVPHRASGLVEDVEYGVTLGLADVRVVYAADVEVRGEMAATGDAARSQRRRWEGGRLALLRQTVPSLLRAAWQRRSAVALDLALDQLVPPLASLSLLVIGGCGVELGLWFAQGQLSWAAGPWALAVLGLALYGLRGVQHSGLGWRALQALLYAPVYIAWKLGVVRVLSSRRSEAWVRTRRSGEDAKPPPPT
ncbi:MAG: glycosyltransferase [Pseudomonadota bacterium]